MPAEKVKSMSILPYYDRNGVQFNDNLRQRYEHLQGEWQNIALTQQKLDHEKEMEAMRLDLQKTIRFKEIEVEVYKAKIDAEALKAKTEAEVLKIKAETNVLKAKTEDKRNKKEKEEVNGTLQEEVDDAALRLNQAYQLVASDLLRSLPSGVVQNQDLRSDLLEFLRTGLQHNNDETSKSPSLSRTRHENDRCAAPPAVATSTNHFWVQLPSSS